MNQQNVRPFTLLGVGFSSSCEGREQVRRAVGEAREQTAGLPSVVALIICAEAKNVEAAVSEAREALPDCTIIGWGGRPCDFSRIFPRGEGRETGILLLASSKIDVKIGVGEGRELPWAERLEGAFEGSFITPANRFDSGSITEQWLIDWYLYRRPAMVLAVIVSPPEQKSSRRQATEDFLGRKFQGRVPVMTCHVDSGGDAAPVLIEGRALEDGIALLTLKTDLLHKVERFHNFEPIGKKYFVTKAEGRRVLELNNRPALPEYLHFTSDSIPDAGSYAGYFPLYPLAYRGREGRYHLFIPEKIHDDMSITLPTQPLVEVPLLPMISISSAQVGPSLEYGGSERGAGTGRTGMEIVLRSGRLRDCAHPQFVTRLHEGGRQSLELHVDGDFGAILPEGDWRGETSHLVLRVANEVEPLAIVATENERLLKEVFSEKSKVEALVEGMAETLYIVDGDYALQYYHGAGSGKVLPGETPEGRRCYEVVFGRELPCPWCALAETLQTRQVVRQTVHLREEESHFQLTFSPWSDHVGQTDYSICLMVDITAQKKMEEQMIKDKKLSSLSVLSAGMAHELNNPLGAINFNLEVLKNREGDAEYRKVLDGVIGDVGRINRIISNLLTFSRSGTKQGEYLNMKQVVDSSVELLAAPMAKGLVNVTTDLPAALPRVWGNLQDLQQVFINLLSNARDALPAGGNIRIDSQLATTPAGVQKIRIVVVYEGKGNVELLRRLQYEDGWDVVYLRAGEEALDYVSTSHMEAPDVLLLAVGDSPGDWGLDRLLSRVQKVFPRTKLMTVTGGEQTAPDRDEPEGTLFQELHSLRPGAGGARGREFLEVRVADDGIGIDPEKADRIFDPFFTTKDEKRGTGLGLSVVHKILENHGADISVASTVGKGTVFAIRFPVTAEDRGPGREPYFKEKRSTWGTFFS